MIGLCQNCDRLRFIPDHSSTLQRTRPSGGSCSTSSSYAHLHRPGDRSENPGVGGSIPSLPTMIFPSDFDDLPLAPRWIFPRTRPVTRPVLDPSRRDLVTSTSDTRLDAGPCWVSWRVCSFTAPSLS